MNRVQIERRSFLKTATQTLLAAPAIVAMDRFATAQQPGQAPQPAHPGAAHKPAPKAPAKPAVTLNVRDYGATGDGKTKDTLAIQQTIERCSAFGGGEVLVPAGDYLTGALALHTNVVLRVEEGATLNGSPDMADYPLAQVRWEGRWIKGYIGFISATDAENIGIVGPGKIVGSPAIKGRVERPSGLRLPALIEFINCRNVRVEDCNTHQFGMWSIHPTYCENITFKNLVIKSGADGIDVDSCRHTVIDGCTFDTGDDCISLKSGRGAEAYTLLRTTVDVRITNCSFADANFACIGIGSETSGGIRGVRIEHCKFLGARSYAIYIKSRPGRGAFIEDITADDLDVSGMQAGFLRINMLDSGKQDEFSVAGDEGIPTVRNFRFTNVRVVDVPTLVNASAIHPRKPLDGFTLSNVTGICGKGIALANVRNARLSSIKVTGYTGPLLSIANVTGTGLAGAITVDAPKLPDPVPPPTTPYQLH
jgi:polygalacturonase